jgi:hypothetical protein
MILKSLSKKLPPSHLLICDKMERPSKGLQMMEKGPTRCKLLKELGSVPKNMCPQGKNLNPRREGGQFDAIQRPPRTQRERKGFNINRTSN